VAHYSSATRPSTDEVLAERSRVTPACDQQRPPASRPAQLLSTPAAPRGKARGLNCLVSLCLVTGNQAGQRAATAAIASDETSPLMSFADAMNHPGGGGGSGSGGVAMRGGGGGDDELAREGKSVAGLIFQMTTNVSSFKRLAGGLLRTTHSNAEAFGVNAHIDVRSRFWWPWLDRRTSLYPRPECGFSSIQRRSSRCSQ